MRAIVVKDKGGPEKMTLEDVDWPTPGDGELLVEVSFAGVNYIDTYHRGGLYPMDFPITPGVEGSGTVVGLGAGVEGFSEGDRVAWVMGLGSYAEAHAVSSDHAVAVPDGVPDDTAAAVLLQGLTAHYLATDTFPLAQGQCCLIHAGAGGVGLLLTQIAKMKGAHVITTVGTHDKAELSHAAGADQVVVYTEADFQEAIEAELGAKPLDVVYDGVGASTFHQGLDLLRPRGLMVTFGNASGPPPEISPLVLSRKGSLFLTRPTLSDYIATREELMARSEDIFSWIGTGDLEVRVGEVYPLAEAAAAHRALESRKTTGKVLIRP